MTSATDRQNIPELLAPAGNWECARAAVANGADAIFFGMPRFNARMRADNFTAEDLPELMQFLHRHGVRGFVTMNTLVFTSELEDAAEQLRVLEQAGVDAIIVQDLGLARLARLVAPRLHLHASTQMTITSPEGLEVAHELNLDRAVLARELSLRELERFQSGPVPLEVFVHGALCVAYSGQCLTSESLGQRSANRGECAQACRMPYELIVDGELRDLGDRRYLLSPQDLAAVNEVPRLIELGVSSFKIEGRLKSPEYVAAVTRVYRKAIDAALAEREQKPAEPVSAQDWYDMEMTFSRGLFSGWMHGVNHQELVGARYGKKRGAYLGRIVDAGRDWCAVDELPAHVKAGDGVVFDIGGDTDAEQGGRIYEVRGRQLHFQSGKVDFRVVPPGTRVWKTSDQVLENRLRSSYAGEIPVRQTIGLHVLVQGQSGQPLVAKAWMGAGLPGHGAIDEESGLTVSSGMPLQTAEKRPLTTDGLTAQLGRLGGTRCHLHSLDNRLEGNVILPISELNRMRRALVSLVEEASTEPRPAPDPDISPRAKVRELLAPLAEAGKFVPKDAPQLSVLCRSVEQIMACAAEGVETIHADFEDIRGYADAVAKVRAESTSRIFLATPRIQKSGEQGFFKLIERAEPHGVLVRNLGGIAHFTAIPGLQTVGDFSLNVANPLTAQWLKERGLGHLTISCDLNIEQVLDLLYSAPPEWFEIILHQHMPMFHMEHCVFAAFMSQGKTFLDCGRPCEHHKVRLRDRTGMEHPLKADVGCRNTLFNAVAQTGAQFFSELHTAGLRRYRIDLMEETPEQIRQLLSAYRRLLSGETDGQRLWIDLKARAQLGVTRGTLNAVE